MHYEILYDPRRNYGFEWVVIQRDTYNGSHVFEVHSEHGDQETAHLVKEALDARKARDNE